MQVKWWIFKVDKKEGIKMQKVVLDNGVEMPILGFGVFQIPNLKECQKCVEDALEAGYKLFDTASAYGNEEAVGAAIRASGIKREEIFVTTKLWLKDANEKDTQKSFRESIKKLGLEYLDLYLIHQPFGDVYGAWRAMSRLYKEGEIKAIGVSNFYADRIVDFCLNNEIKPMINQIECSPFHAQFQAQETMQEYGVMMQSWAPFGEGKNNIFENRVLLQIAQKYQKSIAQIILRWLIQRGIVAIPKTTSKERMKENISVFDFKLNAEEMQTINNLDTKKSLFFDHRDPKSVAWIHQIQ